MAPRRERTPAVRAGTERTEAVVLRIVPYGEADAVVHLWTLGQGRVAAFARSARRTSRRFGAGLEPFCILDVELAPSRRGGLSDLVSAVVREGHRGLRSDLSKLAHAGYATELVASFTAERVPNPRVFELLRSFFSALGGGEARSLRLRAFELALLGEVGLAPGLERCVRCGADACGEAGFDVREGGLVCPSCFTHRTQPFSAHERRLMALLAGAGLPAGEADERDLPLESVRRHLQSFLARHLSRPLRSAAFLQQVDAPP
jgi:DNA repair protein RecO (recombination protein O)